MPIERFHQVDLEAQPESGSLCMYLKDRRSDSLLDLGVTAPAGYSYADRRDLLAQGDAQKEITLLTALLQYYDVLDGSGMRVTIGRTVSVIQHPMLLDPYAVLYVSTSVTPTQEAAIRAAFTAYSPGDDVDAIEQNLLTTAGVPVAAYQVLLSGRIKRRAPPVTDHSNDLIFKKAVGDAGFTTRRTKKLETCKVPIIDDDDTGRVIEVNDPDDPEQGAPALTAGSQCEGLVTTAVRLMDFPDYPEYKWEWELREFKIGSCTVVKTYVPALYTRKVYSVIYAYVFSTADVKKYLENVFKDCIRASVVVAVIGILITGGNFKGALATFQVSMEVCLRAKIEETVLKCVIPDLAILVEKENWTRV